jgi:hypothetical protein
MAGKIKVEETNPPNYSSPDKNDKNNFLTNL